MRSTNRLHDRQSFFKYMPASTAQIVLTTCSLRWSSPILFNDPFDVPRELSAGVTTDELVKASGRRMHELIEHPPENTTELQPKLRLIVEAMRKGVPPQVRKKLLAEIDEVTLKNRPTSAAMEELRELWRSWLPDHRILCLTESPDHVAMWYHYADKYRGVVLELKCVDELNSAWLIARPVEYLAEIPPTYTADGWAEIMTLKLEVAIEKMLYTTTHIKSPDWSYESEWRVSSFKRPADTGHFSDYRFYREELGAIYFGPLVSPDDRRSLCVAARAFPVIRLWDVEIGMRRELTFRAVDA